MIMILVNVPSGVHGDFYGESSNVALVSAVQITGDAVKVPDRSPFFLRVIKTFLISTFFSALAPVFFCSHEAAGVDAQTKV